MKINTKTLGTYLKNNPEYMPYKMSISNSVDKFLTIRETLSRIGRRQDANKNEDRPSLWQVCHIVQDEDTSEFYLVHFKHLYMLNGRSDTTEFNEQDFNQMTYIAGLLNSWKLASFDEKLDQIKSRCNITAIAYADKDKYNLRKKFFIRKKTETSTEAE